jgi:hypothetical protein
MGRPYYEPRESTPEADASYEVVSHDVLFAAPSAKGVEVCHACDGVLEEDDHDAYGVSGAGLLFFSRGEERRTEEPRLCASCGAAIGMTMLTRWAIEEEEG